MRTEKNKETNEFYLLWDETQIPNPFFCLHFFFLVWAISLFCVNLPRAEILFEQSNVKKEQQLDWNYYAPESTFDK